MMTGDLDRAERLLAESVERHRGGPAVFYLGWSLRMLGRTLLLQGRPAEARERIEESLRLFAAAGDVSAILLHLADFADHRRPRGRRRAGAAAGRRAARSSSG